MGEPTFFEDYNYLIIKSIIKVYDKNNNLVDEFEYKRPVTEEIKYHMRNFTELNELLHPGCTFECINYKNGVGEKVKLPDKKETQSLLF